MSRIAAVLMVVAGWLVASPVASAHGNGVATVLAKRASLTHGIAGDQRYVFTTEPGIGPSTGGARVVVLDRFTGREVATLPPPAGGFKLPFTLRVPSPGHLVVLDNAGFPPQGTPKVYDYAYRTDWHGFHAAVTRTTDFSGLPLAFAEDVEVLPDGQYVVSESVIGGLWLIGRDGAIKPGMVPSTPAPLPKIGGCLFPAGPFTVGGLPFEPLGRFPPGARPPALPRHDPLPVPTFRGRVVELP